MIYDIAVIGGGPAGLSAALQARQKGRTVLVIGGGGESALSRAQRVDNYLGVQGLTGRELLEQFRSHAGAAGVEWKSGCALNIMDMKGTFYLSVGSDVVEARAVILATGVVRGAKYPGEAELLGGGVSYCATCDGMLYRGRDVVVIGTSGDAPQEANELQQLGCHVTYVARSAPAGLRSDIPFVKGGKIALLGQGRLRAVQVDDRELPCAGAFILRGSVAPTDLLPGLTLEGGYVSVDRDMGTNIPGVYAAGDCTGLPLQLSKAVGEGLVAGHRAAEHVARQGQA